MKPIQTLRIRGIKEEIARIKALPLPATFDETMPLVQQVMELEKELAERRKHVFLNTAKSWARQFNPTTPAAYPITFTSELLTRFAYDLIHKINPELPEEAIQAIFDTWDEN